MKNIQNNKSGNDGLTKEFYDGFGVKLKNCLLLQEQKQKEKVN